MTKEQLKVGMRIQCQRLQLIGTVIAIKEATFSTQWDPNKHGINICHDGWYLLKDCEPYIPDDMS